jgi:hypothetical protein
MSNIRNSETSHIVKDIQDVPPALDPRYPMDYPHI